MDKAKRIPSIEGILATLRQMGSFAPPIERMDVFNNKIGNIVVNTCIGFDTKKWETGIEKKGNWTIVEQYETREKAKTGHSKWVKKIKANPKLKLTDINVWFGLI